ncbi:hypothetical protein [Paraclostridium sordellii]|uniref:hypothetical protein n=1 Tax=Paraclostridium sordellii TaxID=1505 RepID=UPI00070AAA15|nr:hypothetical protein [Paeniclostridium sordellii]
MDLKYTSNYSIVTPKLRSNTSKYSPKYNPIFGDIKSCFTSDILDLYNLKSTTFDFFIKWNSNKSSGELNTTIWLKRCLEVYDKNLGINIKDVNLIKNKLIENNSSDYISSNSNFFKYNNLDAKFMIIKDKPDEKKTDCKCFDIYENTPLVFSYPVSLNLSSSELKSFTLNQLKNELIANSGGYFKINKPLNYSDTYLEHYLSKTAKDTGATWPGDCDLLLYNKNNECICILEFKKCTSYGNIPIENQSFINYYSKDRSKFMRLGILREYFSTIQGHNVPLINVFYPTTDEKLIKLEVIDGNHKNLSVGNSCTIEIPVTSSDVNLATLKKCLIESILNLK